MDGDETVPDGWKTRYAHCSDGLERGFLLELDGSAFSFFFWQRQALDHLKKSGYQKMDRKWKIPMQWFLNSDWRMSRGRKAALEEIRNRGQKGGHKEV